MHVGGKGPVVLVVGCIHGNECAALPVVRAWGRSRAAARRYARAVGMRYRSEIWPTGAATRWQNGLGETSFVVELAPGPLDAAGVRRHVRALLRLAG